jgi:hypothetical protein
MGGTLIRMNILSVFGNSEVMTEAVKATVARRQLHRAFNLDSSSNIIRLIKSRMRWTGHTEDKKSHKILSAKYKRKRLLGRETQA